MSFIDEFGSKTVGELKTYAKENKIDLFGVSKKSEILEVIASFFPEVGKTEEQLDQIKKINKPVEQVAVFSKKNLYWREVGSLVPGYNIVSKEMSEKWVTHKSVRIADPEEVATFYGK